MAMIHENRAAANMPLMASSSYTSQTYAGNQLAGIGALIGTASGGGKFAGTNDLIEHLAQDNARRIQAAMNQQKEEAGAMANQSKRRLVQVLIADPNENIPIEQCLLYRGDQKLTDANDQELFFELDIKDILAKHNEARVKIVDKKVKERTEYLEPAKIRDLKMVVVTVAEF